MTYCHPTYIPADNLSGFTRGLSDDPDAWKDIRIRAVHSRNSAAVLERKRAEGKDQSTIAGLARATPRGAAVRRPTSVAGRIREALSAGPLGRVELAKAVGVPANLIRQYMDYDIEHGRVVAIGGSERVRYALAREAV